MPAPSGTKRVKGKRISRNIIIGSEAFTLPKLGDPARPKGIPDEHTTKWTVYVRQPAGDPDMTAWLNKVQFKIFQTYDNPLRTIENPPFEVTETGWGGFMVDIRLHFQSISGEKPQYRHHFLQLERYGDEKQKAKQEAENCVRSEVLEVVEFNEPTEALFDVLTSENQWDYLTKGGKKSVAALSASGGPRRGMPGSGERSAQLPERGGEDVAFSKEQEEMLIDKIREAGKEIDGKIKAENQARELVEQRLKELRSELGHEASAQAMQQVSGERVRRR